jgi:hypothetical protein
MTVKRILQQWGVQAVDLLLSKGLSADLLLYLTVEDNCVHVLSRLVETYGAKVYALVSRKNNLMNTPLVATTTSGSARATQWLLEHGADVETRSDTYTVFGVLVNWGTWAIKWLGCHSKGIPRKVE